MSIETKKFVRKPFSVEAVEVTEENMEEVAQWCKGQRRTSAGEDEVGRQRYIKVAVKRPLDEKQTKAYVGDWVVAAIGQNIRGFKVYTPRAFTKSFDEIADDMVDTVTRMEERGKKEERMEQEGLFSEELTYGSGSLSSSQAQA